MVGRVGLVVIEVFVVPGSVVGIGVVIVAGTVIVSGVVVGKESVVVVVVTIEVVVAGAVHCSCSNQLMKI